MYVDLWNNIHASVCSITFMRGSERISSGSGFKVENKLITNNHVIQGPPQTQVQIKFVESDGHTKKADKWFTSQVFSQHLIEGDPENGWDYAIMNLDFPEFINIPSLQLRATDDVQIGNSIALLGFQFEQANLSIHTGTLSSKFTRAGVNYLQLDASVNAGNSGGPLILPETGEVIGIVTRKATGLTQQFDALIASFDHNIQFIQQTMGGVGIAFAGISFQESFSVTQTQLKRIAQELKRSANVGIGYAYEIERIRQHFTQ